MARPSRSAMPGMIVCIGRLPGADRIGMVGIEAETGAAVLQQTPRLGGATSPLPKE